MRVLCGALLLLSACVVSQSPSGAGAGQPPPPRPAPPPPVEERPAPVAEPEEPLYPLDEALADARSGPLTHIGTGPWHGLHRIWACAYRNDEVIVVNAYCTIKEMPAFRIDVFHPTRGRVTIYAEAEKPISRLTRADYFTFKGESEPLAPASAGLPAFSLGMSLAELQAYDKARYEKFLPACWGGVEIHNAQGGCLRELKPLAADFAARNEAFLREPPPEWYQMVKDMRALAAKDGHHVDRPGG
jgi:hypothetical protein